jgi:Na+-transporting NADH:ubiquinone oxidoreductase subunit NqrA
VKFYIGADNLVEANGVRDEITGAYLSTATVTATLFQSSGTTVVSGPVALSYVADSKGDYRGMFDESVSVVSGTRYVLEVKIVQGTYTLPIRNEVIGAYYQGRGRA